MGKKPIPHINVPIMQPNGSMEWAWYLYLKNLTSEEVSYSTTVSVILKSSDWDANNEQTVEAQGVTDDNNIVVSPATASISSYINSRVVCISQSQNAVTFKALSSVPQTNLLVNVLLVP